LILVFLIAMTSFALLAFIVSNGVTLAGDRALLLWLNQHSTTILDTFFVTFTELGGVVAITTVTLGIFLYLLSIKAFSKALFIAVAIGGISAIGFILKALFDRPRPDLWEWIITETYFSFPSGHAVASSALALSIVVLLWQTKWRTLAIIIGSLCVVLIGVSRMYLGVHYPSDILGGWLLSTGWIALTVAVLYRYKRRILKQEAK